MKRLFDIIVSSLFLTILLIPSVLIAILLKLTSKGPIIYWSDRIGRNNVMFRMPKFRTMIVDTPAIATHLLTGGEAYLTPVGKHLRKYSIDEIPQLFSILMGDMTFVGPRPALFNQRDLIELRTERGIQELTPGLTGLAQINGRDELTIQRKVELDNEYLKNKTFVFDMKILMRTFMNVALGKGVKIESDDTPDRRV
ncbi:MAG: sugar transferase [Thermoleophilia bacterium]